MKVTEIEIHRITLPYVDWISSQLYHYYGPIARTIYVVHTDDGLIGLGESHNTEPQETIDGYIGTNPFDHVGDEVSLGLGTAMYDLMGKAVGVPAYKLIGQKHRSWVPVGSWTVSTPPGAHGGGGAAVQCAGLHVAQVSPVTLRKRDRPDGGDAGGGAAGVQGALRFHHAWN